MTLDRAHPRAARTLLALAVLGCGPSGQVEREARPETTGETSAPDPTSAAAPPRPTPEPRRPAACDVDDAGLAIRVACEGGGQPFARTFASDAARGLGDRAPTFEAFAEALPDAALDAAFAARMLELIEAVVREHLPRLVTPGASGEVHRRFLDGWSGLGNREGWLALYNYLREDETLHYNARNGLLGLQVSLNSLDRLEDSRRRSASDFGSSPEEHDRGLASTIGRQLAELAVALDNTDPTLSSASVMLGGALD
ncbi:MAG: hypothetical protein VYE22_40070 [Myxococcota bacterium]|nr:hypothetical protein [Myxococcota bacterium]